MANLTKWLYRGGRPLADDVLRDGDRLLEFDQRQRQYRSRIMKDIRQRFTGMRFIAPALAAALAATFAVGGAIGFTSHRQPQSLIPAAGAGNGMNGMAALTTSFG